MPPTYEIERLRILEMLEGGAISAAEAVQLLEALTGAPPLPDSSDRRPAADPPASPAKPTLEEEQTPSTATATTETWSDPDLEAWRLWWRFPLALGALITLASGVLMYRAFLAVGYGFWFYCSWVPAALGFLVMALAWYSRTARWLHIRIYQGSGDWPGRIALSFPLPIRFTARLLRRFRHWIPALEETSIDELLLALDESTSKDQPFYVEVEDDEDGDRVQVFIG